jgi:ketopantoate reductase
MKVLIVGTGVVGTIYGKVLAEKNEVRHYVRPEKLAATDGRQIPFDLIDERRGRKDRNTTGTYTYNCAAQADDSYDIIMVPVQTQQLAGVLKTLKKQAPNADYLLFTLNWNGAEETERHLDRGQYILGYSGGGGTFKGGLLWANVGRDVMLGTAYPEQAELLKKTDAMFRECGIIPEIPNDPYHWLWMHNIATAPFGAALEKHMDIDRLMADKKLVKTSFKAMRECCAICEKRGVNLKEFAEAGMYNLPLSLICFMFRMNFRRNPAMKRYTAHAIDCLKEMKHNFSQIFDSGLAFGVDMPAMRQLRALINA